MLADAAMARGNVPEAASLLELAAQRCSDASTLLKLATVRRSLGDIPAASAAASAAFQLEPSNPLAALLLGSLREASDSPHAAERIYRVACAHASPRLSLQPVIARQLDRARARVEAVRAWRTALVEWKPHHDLPGLTKDEETRLEGFRYNILENLDRDALAPPIFMIPGIRGERWFEPGEFPGVEEVASMTETIRDEFLALAKSKAVELSSRLNGLGGHDSLRGNAGRWSMIPLIRDGQLVEEFAAHCPRTVALGQALDSPKLGMISPSLHFSMLEPNSRIAPHIGITNARVIIHFPLIVPDSCGFRVGGETREWVVGKPLVFDDMTTHEAWNDSGYIRVVLIADLWRPTLTPLERRGAEMLMDCPKVLQG